jgi:hypothetical protein
MGLARHPSTSSPPALLLLLLLRLLLLLLPGPWVLLLRLLLLVGQGPWCSKPRAEASRPHHARHAPLLLLLAHRPRAPAPHCTKP